MGWQPNGKRLTKEDICTINETIRLLNESLYKLETEKRQYHYTTISSNEYDQYIEIERSILEIKKFKKYLITAKKQRTLPDWDCTYGLETFMM